MKCLNCSSELNETYIVSPEGERFCTEDCLEDFCEKHAIEYNPHPYEEQYMAIRREYIELLGSWEHRLSSVEYRLEAEVDELYEEIDDILENYYEFIAAEGDDGLYAQEIYQYTIKLRKLQQDIFAWRPKRKTYYWISTDLGHYGSDDEKDKLMFEQIMTALYLDGYGEDLIEIMKNHAHPYHWGCNLVFERYEDAKEVFDVLKPYFDRNELELSLIEAYRCEAGCGDIVGNNDSGLFVNGWFYCHSHSENEDYGTFNEGDLQKELNYYAENEEERQIVINGKSDWCYPFKEKIKRSCRTYKTFIPDWALN